MDRKAIPEVSQRRHLHGVQFRPLDLPALRGCRGAPEHDGVLGQRLEEVNADFGGFEAMCREEVAQHSCGLELGGASLLLAPVIMFMVLVGPVLPRDREPASTPGPSPPDIEQPRAFHGFDEAREASVACVARTGERLGHHGTEHPSIRLAGTQGTQEVRQEGGREPAVDVGIGAVAFTLPSAVFMGENLGDHSVHEGLRLVRHRAAVQRRIDGPRFDRLGRGLVQHRLCLDCVR